MRRQGWRTRVEERLSQLEKQDTGRFLAIEMRLARIETAGTDTKPLSALFEEEYAELAREQNTPGEAEAASNRVKRALDEAYRRSTMTAQAIADDAQMRAAIDADEEEGISAAAAKTEHLLKHAAAMSPSEFIDEMNAVWPPSDELKAAARTLKPRMDFKGAIAKYLAGESGRSPYVVKVMGMVHPKGNWLVMSGDDQPAVFCSNWLEAQQVIDGEIELDANFGLGGGAMTVELKQPHTGS